ncbi:hypothetical protein BU16DRAFT_563947 [Lophium mytilinum]|uniref:Uncharacterized protein n=1 Tax=Lophium mytilinum TaxID=390894 RepID=A0A6A6QJL6_9PEZI|nr:hypothetical protein BU16DRAFT_563947 [Lophium mytilinum]
MPPKNYTKRTKPNPTPSNLQDKTYTPPPRTTFALTWPATLPTRSTPTTPCFTCGRRYNTPDPTQPTLPAEAPVRLPCNCILGGHCLTHHLRSSNKCPKCGAHLFEWEEGDMPEEGYVTPTRTQFFAEFGERCPRVAVEELEGEGCGKCLREWGEVVEDYLREVAVRVPCGCVVGRDCFLVAVRGSKFCPACGRLVYVETEGERGERKGLEERLEKRMEERAEEMGEE